VRKKRVLCDFFYVDVEKNLVFFMSSLTCSFTGAYSTPPNSETEIFPPLLAEYCIAY
jgi:hypothetical protein